LILLLLPPGFQLLLLQFSMFLLPLHLYVDVYISINDYHNCGSLYSHLLPLLISYSILLILLFLFLLL
jgi:hypothetical protein